MSLSALPVGLGVPGYAATVGRRLTNGRRGYDHLESLLQIADEIGFVLDADGEPEQGVFDLGHGTRDAGVRHLSGVLDQRPLATETDGKLEDARAARNL